MQSKNTANKQEVEKFAKLAKEWWDPKGKFAPIHKFNPIRQEYLIDKIAESFNLNLDQNHPFKNLTILDVGCGGGLLCEPLARLGANVTGIDAAESNIEVAKIHMQDSGLKINYKHSKPEDLLGEKFDAVLCMEIIEHVEDVSFFVESCVKLLKPNGIIFFATLNRTLKSFALAIVGAEYILRWLPIGTHEWKKFIKPSEMIDEASKNFLHHQETIGVTFNPILNKWKLSNDTEVNYMSWFKKN